jgi:hypothetical protein
LGLGGGGFWKEKAGVLGLAAEPAHRGFETHKRLKASCEFIFKIWRGQQKLYFRKMVFGQAKLKEKEEKIGGRESWEIVPENEALSKQASLCDYGVFVAVFGKRLAEKH